MKYNSRELDRKSIQNLQWIQLLIIIFLLFGFSRKTILKWERYQKFMKNDTVCTWQHYVPYRKFLHTICIKKRISIIFWKKSIQKIWIQSQQFTMSTKKSYKIFLYKISKYSSYWTTMIVKNIIASGIWEKFPLGIISRCTSLFSFYENRERRLIWSLRARVKYSLSVIFSLWTLSHRQSSFIIGTRCLSQPCNFGILNT